MPRKSHFGGSIISLFCDLVTLVVHFLIAMELLLPCAGKASADVASGMITALVGETVTLPCSIPSKDVPTVEWTKKDLSPTDIVFLYRDGCETVGAKNTAFQYRTNLIMKELQNGNLSLIISNLQLSDEGTYQCKIVQGTQPQVVASLDLVVVAESKPNLTVVSNDDHTITLQCEVEYWPPEPEITFLDHQGNEINAEKPQRESRPGGRFRSSRRATLQTSTSRVTCRVHQSKINRTRTADIHILDNRRSIALTVALTLVVALVICGFAFVVYKKPGCKGRVQKSERAPEELPTSPANPRPTPENKEDETQQPSAIPHDHTSGQNRFDSGSSADEVTSHDRSRQSNSNVAAKVCSSNQNDLIKAKDPKPAASSQNRETQPPPQKTNIDLPSMSQLYSNHNKRLSSVSFKRVSAINSSEDSEPLIEEDDSQKDDNLTASAGGGITTF